MKTREETLRENYEVLLMGYAAGLLDMAQNFAIGAHLAFSPRARDFVRRCEAIGGALIEHECAPQPLKESCLHSLLARLEEPGPEPASRPRGPQAIPLPDDLDIPPEALRHIICRQAGPAVWKRLLPGMERCEIPLECRSSHAQFIKARPAARMPRHAHKGMEITLVLRGGYRDEFGAHEAGDLLALDSDFEHDVEACCERGMVTLVVSSAPARFTGLARLLNPFFRF